MCKSKQLRKVKPTGQNACLHSNRAKQSTILIKIAASAKIPVSAHNKRSQGILMLFARAIYRDHQIIKKAIIVMGTRLYETADNSKTRTENCGKKRHYPKSLCSKNDRPLFLRDDKFWHKRFYPFPEKS